VESSEFKASGATLSYAREGRGPERIVFVHGLCGTKEIWSKQAAFFAQGGVEAVAVDCLGHGKSSAVDARELVQQSAAAIARLLESMPSHPTTLVGHSVGGLIVNKIARLYLKAARVVFVDSPCLHASEDLARYHERGTQLFSSHDKWKMVDEWYRGFLTPACAPAERESIVAEALRFSPDWIAGALQGLRSPVKIEGKRPVLVMDGNQFFPAGARLSWKSFYPDAKHWLYPGPGHFYFLEDPNAFNLALAEFLEGARG
jgi:pimeloyl-ACP methyl ester carboxylesterase